jgi:hypothetical protein
MPPDARSPLDIQKFQKMNNAKNKKIYRLGQVAVSGRING